MTVRDQVQRNHGVLLEENENLQDALPIPV